MPEFYTMQQSDILSVGNNAMPYITSLHSFLNRIKGDGYTENFEKTLHGIHSVDTNHYYLPADFKITNFFKFEGDHPGKNTITYLIETSDGIKGTLVISDESLTDKTKAGLFTRNIN